MADNKEQDECLSEAEERRLAQLPAELVARIDQAVSAVDRIASKLTLKQKAEVQKRVISWKPTLSSPNAEG